MSIPILSSIFGDKPQIADYQSVDLSQEQLDQLFNDIQSFPEIEKLGSLYQDFLLNSYEKAIPGFRDILALGGKTTKDMLSTADTELHGVIPEDVAKQVQASSAFENLMSGAAGSPMGNANTARNLGLTSLDLINQGANLAGAAGNAAQRWASLSGAGAASGFMQSQFITPFQRAQFDMQQNLIKRNVQQQKFNVEAAPNPIAKGLSDIVMYLTGQYLGSLGGGKMGGSGGGLPSAGNSASAAYATDLSSPGYSSVATDAKDVGSPTSFNDTMPLPTGDIGPTTSGFDYGTGYPASDPAMYYGGGAFSQYGGWDPTFQPYG